MCFVRVLWLAPTWRVCSFSEPRTAPRKHSHRRFIYKGDTRTRAQGTAPRVALGA